VGTAPASQRSLLLRAAKPDGLRHNARLASEEAALGYWVGAGADTRLTSRPVVARQTRGAPDPPICMQLELSAAAADLSQIVMICASVDGMLTLTEGIKEHFAT
jgi:hypothetical protein